MTDQKPQIPYQSAVSPEALDGATEIRFRCFKGISCFNACCRNADVTLAPYDIVRLKRRLGMTSSGFLAKHTVPFQMDADGMPGVKLKTTEDGACLLLDSDEGCSVYSDRPTVCRYYPVALLALREKDVCKAKQQYSLVREEHCKGHDEDRAISIANYRTEQGCEIYDELNREWYELILKKKSAGPTVGRPPLQSLQLFFMASYDLDTFRRFVLSDKFRGAYALPEALYAEVEQRGEALLKFAYRFLRQVLFGERSIEEGPNAWERRVEQRKEVWDARRRMEIQHRQAAEDEKYGDCGDG
jgi:Fe-S-cluster containining protein